MSGARARTRIRAAAASLAPGRALTAQWGGRSEAMSHDSANLATPDIKWLGGKSITSVVEPGWTRLHLWTRP